MFEIQWHNVLRLSANVRILVLAAAMLTHFSDREKRPAVHNSTCGENNEIL